MSYINENNLIARMESGIERYRKGDVVIQLLDASGRPAAGEPVSVEQGRSAFHFGVNGFLLDGFPSAEENRRYESVITDLFNAVTVPFYWRDLEPERGALRYTADSPPISRRPPPDRVVAFCERNGLRMHGHPLVWNHAKWSAPDWLPDDPAEAAPLWEGRIREIAGRYSGHIHRWDALNEYVDGLRKPEVRAMPEHYEQLAFEWAKAAFPAGTRFDINETTGAWGRDAGAYRDVIARLIDSGAALGGIGLQFHLFSENSMRELLDGRNLAPETLFEVLDEMARFSLPIHVSEITLPSPKTSPNGLEEQAAMAVKLYRLWFSHPSVEGITWWNLVDGGSASGENTIASGLLDANLEPKPAYHALRRLLHDEWRTRITGRTDAAGQFRFRGFHGSYVVRTPLGELTAELTPSTDSAPQYWTVSRASSMVKP
jgi:GH35 family endo-1,4-beta-xylanase